MKQREVTDEESIRWTCVQAFSMAGSKVAEKAAELQQNEEGKVMVVCTPTGGVQSVRIELDRNWEDQVTDEQILEAIKKAAS